MGRKALIPLVLGLGIGLLAVKLIVNSIQKAQAGNQARQIVNVVRAKQDIMAYEEISKESIEVVETADNLFAPANERIETIEKAVGRVSSKPIPRNAPVLQSMLAPEGTKPGLLGRIPPGHRAVAVKIDESSSAGYQLQPGAWVDVIVVMDVESSTKGKKETLAEVILQHVQVASIGHDSSPEAEAAGKQMKPAKSATLFVPESDVPKLHLAGTRGKITLAMRGEDDVVTSAVPAKAFGNEILTSMQAGAVPPPAPPSPPPATMSHRPVRMEEEPQPVAVLVFHGTTRSAQPGTIERIIFENAKSPKIIDMQGGAPTRAGSSLESKRAIRPRPSPTSSPSDETVNPPSDASNDGATDESDSDGL